jgi:photoactive yellow protein
MDELMTTQEAAERLGVGPTTVKRWADEGRLEVVRTLGGHRRFTRASVERVYRQEQGEPSGRPLHERLAGMTTEQLDTLAVGVIGFDDQMRIRQYNRFEVDYTGFRKVDVMGRHLFGEVAPCMNNDIIFGRVLDGVAAGNLDFELDYTFNYRIRVRLAHLHFYRDRESGTNWLLVRPRAAATADLDAHLR